MFRTPIKGEGEHVDYYCKAIVKGYYSNLNLPLNKDQPPPPEY
jgi:hypothetical protein